MTEDVLPETASGRQHLMEVSGTCALVVPHLPLPGPFLRADERGWTLAVPSGLEAVGSGQAAPWDSPTFFLCRARTTPIATTPAASTRPRGTRVETSTLEPPPYSAGLGEGLT